MTRRLVAWLDPRTLSTVRFRRQSDGFDVCAVRRPELFIDFLAQRLRMVDRLVRFSKDDLNVLRRQLGHRESISVWNHNASSTIRRAESDRLPASAV
jgi:hypothetical protein